MPTLNAFSESSFGRVRLEADFADTPAATYAHIHREIGTPRHSVSNPSPIVRMPGPTFDFTDDYATWALVRPSNGLFVLYDTEMPLDVAVTYRLDTAKTLATAFDDSSSVIVLSGGAIWLKDPIRPAHDLQITVPTNATDPACDPATGIYFVGFEGSSYATAAGRFPVEASEFPAVSVKRRKSFTSSMVLVTRQLTDRDRLRRLLSSGGPLFLQTPSSWGYGDIYIDVADVEENRLSRDHRVPWRQWTLPFVQVAQPGGLQYGVDGARSLDLCDVYATWGAINAAGKTWLDVMQREAG